MILRNLVVGVALLAAGSDPTAVAQVYKNPVMFDRQFSYDVEGGHFIIAEDPKVSGRFRESTGVVAEFQVVAPHRTKDFGSAVAFVVTDASGDRSVAIIMRDTLGKAGVNLKIIEWPSESDKKGAGRDIADRELSIKANAIGRVRIRKEKTGQVIVDIDRQTFTFRPAFDADRLMIQIYCANGWARFLDGELVS